MSAIMILLSLFAVFTLVHSVPVEEWAYGYNASHAVARGIVERSSDYYCHHHCGELCHNRAGWCCGVDDCHYGSQLCACYNICYCGHSGYTYRCHTCDIGK